MSSSSPSLTDVKRQIRALLLSVKGGCTQKQLYNDYNMVVGENVPFKDLGYASFTDFVTDISDVVSMRTNRDGHTLLHAIPDRTTERISRLVSKQKSSRRAVYVQPPPARKRQPSKRIPAEFSAHLRQLFHCYPKGIPYDRFDEAYARRFGHYLRIRNWGYTSLEELLEDVEGAEMVRDPLRGSFIIRPNSKTRRSSGEGRGSVARDSLNALETSPDREMDRKKESISNGKEKKELTKLPKPPVPEGLISNIREFLQANPAGVWLSEFATHYKDYYGEELPVFTQGYSTPLHLLSSLPQCCAIERPQLGNGDWLVSEVGSIVKIAPNHAYRSAAYISESLTTTIHGILEPAGQDGVMLKSFLSSYKEKTGRDLDIKDMGFNTLVELLERVEGVSVMKPPDAGFVMVYGPRKNRRGGGGRGGGGGGGMSSGCDSETDDRPRPKGSLTSAYTKQSIPKEKMIGVYVTHVHTPSCMCVQVIGAATTTALESLLEDLTTFYNGSSGDKCMLKKPCIGEPVCTIFNNDGYWYRAEVVAIPTSDIAEVLYVDYGNIGRVPSTSLRKPKPHYMTLPAQAIKCRMAHLKPTGNRWSVQASRLLFQMTKDKPIVAIVSSIVDGLMSVSLCDTTSEEDIHINDVMVSQGLAVFVKDTEEEQRKYDGYLPEPLPQGATEDVPILCAPSGTGQSPPPPPTPPAPPPCKVSTAPTTNPHAPPGVPPNPHAPPGVPPISATPQYPALMQNYLLNLLLQQSCAPNMAGLSPTALTQLLASQTGFNPAVLATMTTTTTASSQPAASTHQPSSSAQTSVPLSSTKPQNSKEQVNARPTNPVPPLTSDKEEGWRKDLPKRNVKRVQLTNENEVHVIHYNGKAYVLSPEVSEWFWDTDLLQSMLRQVQNARPVWGMLLQEQRAKDLYREMKKIEKLRTLLYGCSEVTIYSLHDLPMIVSAFHGPESLCQAVRMESDLWLRKGMEYFTDPNSELQALHSHMRKLQDKRLEILNALDGEDGDTFEEARELVEVTKAISKLRTERSRLEKQTTTSSDDSAIVSDREGHMTNSNREGHMTNSNREGHMTNSTSRVNQTSSVTDHSDHRLSSDLENFTTRPTSMNASVTEREMENSQSIVLERESVSTTTSLLPPTSSFYSSSLTATGREYSRKQSQLVDYDDAFFTCLSGDSQPSPPAPPTFPAALPSQQPLYSGGLTPPPPPVSALPMSLSSSSTLSDLSLTNVPTYVRTTGPRNKTRTFSETLSPRTTPSATPTAPSRSRRETVDYNRVAGEESTKQYGYQGNYRGKTSSRSSNVTLREKSPPPTPLPCSLGEGSVKVTSVPSPWARGEPAKTSEYGMRGLSFPPVSSSSTSSTAVTTSTVGAIRPGVPHTSSVSKGPIMLPSGMHNKRTLPKSPWPHSLVEEKASNSTGGRSGILGAAPEKPTPQSRYQSGSRGRQSRLQNGTQTGQSRFQSMIPAGAECRSSSGVRSISTISYNKPSSYSSSYSSSTRGRLEKSSDCIIDSRRSFDLGSSPRRSRQTGYRRQRPRGAGRPCTTPSFGVSGRNGSRGRYLRDSPVSTFLPDWATPRENGGNSGAQAAAAGSHDLDIACENWDTGPEDESCPAPAEDDKVEGGRGGGEGEVVENWDDLASASEAEGKEKEETVPENKVEVEGGNETEVAAESTVAHVGDGSQENPVVDREMREETSDAKKEEEEEVVTVTVVEGRRKDEEQKENEVNKEQEEQSEEMEEERGEGGAEEVEQVTENAGEELTLNAATDIQENEEINFTDNDSTNPSVEMGRVEETDSKGLNEDGAGDAGEEDDEVMVGEIEVNEDGAGDAGEEDNEVMVGEIEVTKDEQEINTEMMAEREEGLIGGGEVVDSPSNLGDDGVKVLEGEHERENGDTTHDKQDQGEVELEEEGAGGEDKEEEGGGLKELTDVVEVSLMGLEEWCMEMMEEEEKLCSHNETTGRRNISSETVSNTSDLLVDLEEPETQTARSLPEPEMKSSVTEILAVETPTTSSSVLDLIDIFPKRKSSVSPSHEYNGLGNNNLTISLSPPESTPPPPPPPTSHIFVEDSSVIGITESDFLNSSRSTSASSETNLPPLPLQSKSNIIEFDVLEASSEGCVTAGVHHQLSPSCCTSTDNSVSAKANKALVEDLPREERLPTSESEFNPAPPTSLLDEPDDGGYEEWPDFHGEYPTNIMEIEQRERAEAKGSTPIPSHDMTQKVSESSTLIVKEEEKEEEKEAEIYPKATNFPNQCSWSESESTVSEAAEYKSPRSLMITPPFTPRYPLSTPLPALPLSSPPSLLPSSLSSPPPLLPSSVTQMTIRHRPSLPTYFSNPVIPPTVSVRSTRPRLLQANRHYDTIPVDRPLSLPLIPPSPPNSSSSSITEPAAPFPSLPLITPPPSPFLQVTSPPPYITPEGVAIPTPFFRPDVVGWTNDRLIGIGRGSPASNPRGFILPGYPDCQPYFPPHVTYDPTLYVPTPSYRPGTWQL